jgi:hypothetical protein
MTSPQAPETGADETYTRTLRDLWNRHCGLTEAMAHAERIGPAGRGSALSEVHTLLRGMAAVANHALGGWPEPQPDPQ